MPCLFVRDFATGVTTFVPGPTKPSQMVSSVARAFLSRDGYSVVRADSAYYPNSIVNRDLLTHLRLAGAPASASAGCSFCYQQYFNPVFIGDVSTSADATEVAYALETNQYVTTPSAYLWNTSSGWFTTVHTESGSPKFRASIAVSPDGASVLFESEGNGSPDDSQHGLTCRLQRASVDTANGAISAVAPVFGPSQGLPRTGCQGALNLTDSGVARFYSSETNLLAVSVLGSDDPYAWSGTYLGQV